MGAHCTRDALLGSVYFQLPRLLLKFQILFHIFTMSPRICVVFSLCLFVSGAHSFIVKRDMRHLCFLRSKSDKQDVNDLSLEV